MKLLVITSRWLLLVEKWKKTYLNIQCQPVFPDRQCKEVFFSRYSSTCSRPSSETNSCRFVLKTRQSKLHFWSVDLKIHAAKNTEKITGELGQGYTDSSTESEFTDSILLTRSWVVSDFQCQPVWCTIHTSLPSNTHSSPETDMLLVPLLLFPFLQHAALVATQQFPKGASCPLRIPHAVLYLTVELTKSFGREDKSLQCQHPAEIHAIQSKIPYSESVTEQAQVCPNSRVSSSLSNLDWNSLSRNAEKELLSSAQTQSSQSTSTVKLSSPHSGPIVALATLRCCLSKESAAT